MRYMIPEKRVQRQPVEPHTIISGGIPGATELRIGGNENVKISGLEKRITVTIEGGTVSLGKINEGGSIGFSINDGTTDFLTITKDGIEITDGTVTTTITAAGITQNDSVYNRLFLGNE